MARRRGSNSPGGRLVVLAVLAVVVLGGLYVGAISVDDLLGESSQTDPSNAARVSGDGSDARASLDTLTVEPAGSMSGYSREAFPHWSDALENGWDVPSESCDARDAALIRDGDDVVVGDSCSIDGGTWDDPYSDAVNTDSSSVDIDHIVPLANAWRSGAAGWDEAERERFANAPDNLLAADAGENRSKGDRGPEAWRPPDETGWCHYAIRWTLVKDEYALSVNPEEKAAIEEMLATCGGGS